MAKRLASAAPLVHYLHPGHVFVSAEPYVVTTILGTCVAVCLFDASSAVGGLNHFLLPHLISSSEHSTRFGVVAMATLLEQVIACGARPSRLQAKVFGGMNASVAFQRAGKDLGANNVALALEFLEARRIPVIGRDVGGVGGRKLVFHVADGTAWLKHL